jgi:hypothetical protein
VKVLICGDREWDHYEIMEAVIRGLYGMYGKELHIIEGEARGADQMAGEIAGLMLPKENIHKFPADWKKFNRAAGPLRNRAMLKENPDLVLAFHDDLAESRGTKDMVNIATKKGVPVYVIGKRTTII